jgi:serine/threonine protein phosphatase 1
MKKIYAIGDIHGSYDRLKRMLPLIPFQPGDTLVFLGDYVDRGYQSKEVLDLLMYLKDLCVDNITPTGVELVFLMGNHEYMMLDAIDGININLWMANGGTDTMRPFHDKLPDQKYIDFLKSLQLYYETEDYIFVHAGISPRTNVNMSLQCSDDLLWIRMAFIEDNSDYGKKIIFGHTPFQKPLIKKNKIGIDTGACFGKAVSRLGNLTCIQLPDEKFIQVGRD